MTVTILNNYGFRETKIKGKMNLSACPLQYQNSNFENKNQRNFTNIKIIFLH